MRYKLWILVLALISTNCDLMSDTLNGCFITLPEDLGGYEIKQIPDFSINVGDTLWFARDTYFKAYDRCDAGYGFFDMDFLVMDYDHINFIQSETNFGIVAKKTGNSKVDFRGTVILRRDGEDKRVMETGSFRVKTFRAGANSYEKPSNVLPPFYSIDSVHVDVELRNEITNVETKFVFDTGYSSDEYYILYSYWDENNSGELIAFNVDNGGGNERFGPRTTWDSLTTTKYLKLRRLNRDNWVPETESYIEGVSSYVQNFIKIESYPIEKPVAERTFIVSGF